MAKHTVKNISPGIRGFNSVDHGLLELAPGASTLEPVEISDGELRASAATGWFEFNGSSEAPETGPADDLDTTVAKLREIATAEGVDLNGVTAKADIQAAIRIAREGKAAGDKGGEGDLDAMDDATLLTTASAITGTPAADLEGKSRDELLALARG